MTSSSATADIPLLVTSADSTPANTLQVLHDWAKQGWLRRLDSAMAALMRELDPKAPPVLLVCTAMLGQMEGRGHTCLPLPLWVTQPQEVLAWPPAAQLALHALWRTLPQHLSDWLSTLATSVLVRNMQQAEAPPDQGQPMVLGGTPDTPVLYWRRYWLHEQHVAQQVLARTCTQQAVDESRAQPWLHRLFDSATPQAIDWQKLACAVALRASLSVITGGPGTGKTYTAARLLALLFAMHPHPERLRVALAAPTGKAAARLRQAIDQSLQELSQRLGPALDLAGLTQRMGAAKTLHALLGARPDTREFRFNASRPLDVDVLIVDEASMVHLEMMSALLQALPAQAKLILLGDKDQLASVEAGAVLGDLCRHAASGRYNPTTVHYAQTVAGFQLPAEFCCADEQTSALAQQTVMLRESRRFGGRIGELALAVNAGNATQARQCFSDDTSGALQALTNPPMATVLNLALNTRPGAAASYADYLVKIKHAPPEAFSDADQHSAWAISVLLAFDRFRLLCAVHDGDWGTQQLNTSVQRALANAGLLQPKGEWFAGRPVMVTRNDPELGVFNGDVGITLASLQGDHHLRVYFLDGDSLRSVSCSRLAHVETAFAMTVHKSQGSEFMHTALILPKGSAKFLTRELVYTGITRARKNFTLIEAQEGLLREAVAQPSQRASGLARALGG
jgi:exodeoxyribonuclease V alpha subunit